MNGAKIKVHPLTGEKGCDVTNAAKYLGGGLSRTALYQYMDNYTGIYKLRFYMNYKSRFITIAELESFKVRTANAPSGYNQNNVDNVITNSSNVSKLSK